MPAKEFEILNASINLRTNSANADKNLQKTASVLNQVSKASKVSFGDFVKLSQEASRVSSTVKGLNATLVQAGNQFNVVAKGAKTFSISASTGVDESVQNINRLTDRLKVLEKTQLDTSRGIRGFASGLADSFALVRSGGSVLVGVDKALFGLSSRSNIVTKTFGFLTRNASDLNSEMSRLEKSSLKTAKTMGTVGQGVQDALISIKELAKAEGTANKVDFTTLTTNVNNLTNEYQRLQASGKATPKELRRIQVEADAVNQSLRSMIDQGLAPIGSKTREGIAILEKQMQKGETATRQLVAETKALEKQQEKIKASSASAGTSIDESAKRGRFSWSALFNIFRFGSRDIQKVDESLKKVDTTLKQTGRSSEVLRSSMFALTGGLVGGGLAIAIPKVFDVLRNKFTGSIEAASEAEEEMNKFLVVFDSAEDEAKGFADTLVQSTIAELDAMAETLGRSRFELRAFAAKFQDTFVPLGFARGEAAKLSVGLTGLTEDLSSFYNMAETEVSDRIASFLVGNYENARAFGSIVTDARLEAELLSLGIEGGTRAVDQQVKSMVALRLLYKDTSDAQGDVTRSATSFANQMRVLQGRARDSAVEFGQRLLPIINPLLSLFIRLSDEVGPKLSGAFERLNNVIAPISENLTSLLSGGSMEEIFASFADAVSNGIQSIADRMNDFIPFASDWAYNWGVEIYNGLIDMANTLLVEAMNYIGEIFASFLQPGSPPEKGPLSSIDEWGEGIMDTFSSGLSDNNLEDQLTKATINVLKARQDILDAEKEGYVPPELKEKLKLAEQEKKNIEDQIAAQKNLGKETEKAATKAAGGGSGRSGASSPKERAAVEKKTAQQIRDEALAVLDQQLEDGVIKYEDYAKKKLDIEKKFYQDTLAEGLSVDDATIQTIKDLQAEVDSFGKKGGKGAKLGLGDLGLTVEDFIPKPGELTAQVGDAVGEVATKAVESVRTKIVESGTKIRESIFSVFTTAFNNLRDWLTNLSPEYLLPVSLLLGLATSPALAGLQAVFAKIGNILVFVTSKFGGLFKILKFIIGQGLKLSLVGLIVYAVITNWDEIVSTVTETFSRLRESMGGIISRFTDFINRFRDAVGATSIITDLGKGFSLLGATLLSIAGLAKKVFKLLIVEVFVKGFTKALEIIDTFSLNFIENFGGMDKFVTELVDSLEELASGFSLISAKLYNALKFLIEGDFESFNGKLKEIGGVFADIFGPGSSTIQFLGDVGQALFDMLPPTVQDNIILVRDAFLQFVENLKTSFQPTIEALRPLMEQFGLLWQQLKVYWVELLPVLKVVGQVLGVVLVGAIGLAINLIVSLIQTAVQTLPFLINAITGFVQAIRGVISFSTGIIQIIKGIFAGLKAIFTGGDFTQAKELLLAGIQSIQAGMINILGGLGVIIVNLMTGALSGFISLLQNFALNIARVIGAEYWVEIFEFAMERSLEVFRDFGTNASNFIREWVDKIVGFFQDLAYRLIGGSVFTDMIDDILDALKNFIGDFIGTMGSWVGEAVAAVIPMAPEIISTILGGLDKAKGLVGDALSGLFGGRGDTEEAAAGQSIDTSQGDVAVQFTNTAIGSIQQNIQSLQLIFNSFAAAVFETGVELAKNLLGFFITLEETLVGDEGKLIDISEQVVNILTTLGFRITSILYNANVQAVGQFDLELWKKVGKEIIEGLIDGVEENKDKFIEKLRSIAEKAAKEASKELGIKSPSIVFREIGAQVMEGFNEGLALKPPNIKELINDAIHDGEGAIEKFLEKNMEQASADLVKDRFNDVLRANAGLLALSDEAAIEAFKNLDPIQRLYSAASKGSIKGLNTSKLNNAIARLIPRAKEFIGNANDEYTDAGTEFANTIVEQQVKIIDAFNTTTEQVRFQANRTRNELEGIFKKPLDDNSLQKLFNFVQGGGTFGEEVDSKIKIAYLSTQKLTGALEDRLKVEKEIANIQELQASLAQDQVVDVDPIAESEAAALGLLDSLSLGINATVPEVLGTLSQLGTDMIDSMEDLFQIGSPSRVFETIGKDIGYGFLGGLGILTDSIPGLVNDTASMLVGGLIPMSSALNPNGLGAGPGPTSSVNINNNFNNNIANGVDIKRLERRIIESVSRGVRQ